VALLKKVIETNDLSLLHQYKSFLLPDNAYTPMGTSFLEAYSNHTSQVNRNRGFDSVSSSSSSSSSSSRRRRSRRRGRNERATAAAAAIF